jgi:hypothetical protein
VTLGDHALEGGASFTDRPTHHEGRRHAVLGEQVEHLGSLAGVRTVVERDLT